MALLGLDQGFRNIAADDIELGRLGKGNLVVGVLLGLRVGKGDLDLVFLLELRCGLGDLAQVSGAQPSATRGLVFILVEVRGPLSPRLRF